MRELLVIVAMILLGVSVGLNVYFAKVLKKSGEIQLLQKRKKISIITTVILLFVLFSAFFFNVNTPIIIVLCIVGFAMDMLSLIIK